MNPNRLPSRSTPRPNALLSTPIALVLAAAWGGGASALAQATTSPRPAAQPRPESSRTPATQATLATAPVPAPAAKTAPDAPVESDAASAAVKPDADATPKAPTLEETRLTLSKWIETQQIISKERNDWQQGKEILQGRVELVGKEVTQLKDRIAQSEAAVQESNRKRDELAKQNAQLKETSAQLASSVSQMEARVRKLAKVAPEGVAKRLEPLLQRIPADPASTRVSVAERFQNVLGILNELNKANSEITIAYEIRQLSDGSSSEVQVIYVGLAQAYYLSPRGEAGIGRPTDEGWTWSPAGEQADEIYTALEIIQGKHPPAFVALPVSIQ